MLTSSMRVLLLSLAAMAVGVWWEMSGRLAAQTAGCGSALCNGVTATPPTFTVGTCAIGTSNATYGGSANFATGNANHCGTRTLLGQEAKLYKVAQGGGADQVIDVANPTPSQANCGVACPLTRTIARTTFGCKCLRGQQYYSWYGAGGYAGLDGNTCALVGLYEVTQFSTQTTAP